MRFRGRLPGLSRPSASKLKIALAVVLAVLVGSCTGAKEEPAPPTTQTTIVEAGGVLRLAAVGKLAVDPAIVNPADKTSLMISDMLYDGLTALDPVSQEVTPALAKSWESDEALTSWTFTLRDDAVFSNGAPITAADVKASVERIANQGSSSLAGVRLEIIVGYDALVDDESVTTLSGVEVIDDHVVVFRLNEAFSAFPDLLSIPEFAVLPAGTAVPEASADLQVDSVTSGPFVIAEASEQHVRLEKSKTSKALLDGVDVAVFESAGDAYQAFVKGDVDWSAVPTAEREHAKTTQTGYSEQPLDIAFWFGINLADPDLNNERFRQALVKAVDREAIVSEVLPGRLPLNGVVVAGVPGASDDACGETCKFDPEASRAILTEVFPDGNVPTIEIDYYDDAVQQAIADAVRADLEAVGVPTTARNLPFGEYREFVASGEPSIFSFGWIGLAPIADSYLGPLIISDSADNVVSFRDPVVDQAIRDARATRDAAERMRKYQAIERDVISRVPLIPIAQFTAPQVLAVDRVHGWAMRLDGTLGSESVWVSG